MSLLELQNVGKAFGATHVLRDVNLQVIQGERHALIGPNGAGKSTLFHLVSGHQRVSGGRILFKGAPIHTLAPWEIARRGVARSFQISSLFPQLSVFENLRCALLFPLGYGYSFWHLLSRETALNARTDALLDELGLWDQRHLPAGELAYAGQRALELGLAIAGNAELILLDEPVAGMSHSEARRALDLIRKVTAGRTLLLVEHDMSIVFEIAERISVLDQGVLIASGTPEAIRGNARVQAAYLGAPAGGEHA